MSVKITELPILDSLADNDILAGVDSSANITSKIELGTLKNYIDTNTQYTAGTNIDITNNVISAPDVYNKNEMDNQIEELQNEVDSLSTIFNAFPTESGEGESLTLDDTAEVKFKKFDLKGNTSQSGTPTPSSPIPVNVVSGDNEIIVSGHNLFNKATIIEGKYIDGSGNFTTDNDNFIGDFIPINSANNYYVSASTSQPKRIAYYNSLQTFISRELISATGGTLTIPTNTCYVRLSCYNVDLDSLQLEYGTTKTTYQSFNGLDTYNIDLPVENLFEGVFEEGGWDIQNGQKQYAPGRNRCPDLIPVNPSTTYTISFESTGTCYVLEYGSNSDYLTYSQVSYRTYNGSFTTNANTRYITFYYIPYNHDFTLNEECQLEKGPKANKYTPYGTTPIELCKIGNYQDYFYKDSDKWYLHKEIKKKVLNGTEGWAIRNQGDGSTTISFNHNMSGIGAINLYSDRFSQSSGSTDGIEGIGIPSQLTQIYIQIKRSRLSSLDSQGISAWLSNNNTTLYYILATPTNTEITYQPLIDQLNAIEQAQSKENQTNISQVNNDLPFIISAEAILSLKNVLDRIELLES